MRIIILIFLALSQLALAQSSEKSVPTTFILIRHAEKADDGTKDPPLSDDGVKRAARLVEVLRNTNVTAIYSSNYKRTRNTVLPLAQSKNLEVKIYQPTKEDEIQEMINANRGGTVVICGHSNSTPWTANFLTGSKLESFSESDYGNILIVTFWDFGKTAFTRLNY